MNNPAYSLSNPERITRGVRVLFRTMRPRHDDLILPEIQHTQKGYEYNIYYPSGKAIHTVVLIYGMTINGANDSRLRKFAQACSSAGLKVAVPILPGLMDFRIASNDMERLVDIVNELAQKSSEKIGLLGFSTGGSYSLLLAAHPTLRDKIGPVLLFSPIYDARDVFELLHSPTNLTPQTSKEWDQFYWAQLVIAFRNRKRLGLSKTVQGKVQAILAEWGKYDLKAKRSLYQDHIASLTLTMRKNLFNEGMALDQLSARGQLKEVKSQVFILHDARDLVVPPEHSRRMYAELALRGEEFHQEVLVTPWLSHTMLQNTGSLSEFIKIVTFIAELFR